MERELRVGGFRLPPSKDDGRDVPVVRFPVMHSCPKCHRLERHAFFTSFRDNKCSNCKQPLIPSRFVIVCERGHIDDFPYFDWVHKGTRPSEGKTHKLKIFNTATSASLQDIVIECSCGKSSTMRGAFRKEALRDVAQCGGKRPWLGDREECGEIPRTLQRGASNAYFAVTRSAISIPPWSEGAFKTINHHWKILKYIPDDALRATLESMGIAESSGISVDDLLLAIGQRKGREGDPVDDTQQGLKRQEYEALVKGRAETSRQQDFVCVPSRSQGEVTEWFDQVMLVTRLREVRALESFTRLLPPMPSDRPDRRAPLTEGSLSWLPAIEVIGEGVFLRLNQQHLEYWERDPEVQKRARKLEQSYIAKCAQNGVPVDREVSPRLVLVHTLAHALINQWSLDCGYPAAALAERLYVSDGMAGLLIYTATTDSAGSLGGVVSRAESGNLAETLREAIEHASWCSSDPLCIESEPGGTDALNLAACHACVLLPEPSCEEHNVLLDRALLVGTPGKAATGYFSSLVG